MIINGTKRNTFKMKETISKILKGRENLSLEAISKIENALDIHFLQIVSQRLHVLHPWLYLLQKRW